MKRLGILMCAGIFLAAFAGFAEEKADAILKADLKASGTPVSPALFGAFFEDINYGADGGLYAEMVRNRSFESEWGASYWRTVGSSEELRILIRQEQALNPNNPSYAQVRVGEAGEGISNAGYGGMRLKKGDEFTVSAYLRSVDHSQKSLSFVLDDRDDGRLLAHADISGVWREWTRFEARLECAESSEFGRINVLAKSKGTFDIDMVSLFPAETFKNRPNGLRKDIAQKIADMKPGFLRFPGGCIVEGQTMGTAYRWKDSIGDIAARRENPNLWGYRQSYGLGFFEYFQFCADIGAEAVPVLNCGMACQARKGDMIPLEDLDPYIQDALDLIEYANGGPDTEWGSVRAKSGSLEPFDMKYLGIGNEQWGTEYYLRYAKFARAIEARYPDIQLIFAAGPLASGIPFDEAWRQAKSLKADLVDEHYYMSPEWFLASAGRYDTYDRKGPKVFAGEYAAHTARRSNSLFAALAEAAFMTGLEKNGDVVTMAAYAPLLARDGSAQWAPDLIWFNDESAFGTPSYYVQSLFAAHKSRTSLPYSLAVDPSILRKTPIGGSVGLGSWSTQVDYKDVKVVDKGGKVLLAPKFDSLDGWTPRTGNWSLERGVLSQRSASTDCRLSYDSGELWSEYAFEAKARKRGGAEGMLILFGIKGSNYYWWNLGGWGNTVSAIEKGSAATRGVIGESLPLRIETDRWYDIKVSISGDLIRCYLDGRLIHELRDPQGYDPLYSHVGRAENGEILVKLVNLDARERKVRILLDGSLELEPECEAIVLSGATLDEANSFSKPEAISPKSVKFGGVSPDFMYPCTANSLTILRLKEIK